MPSMESHLLMFRCLRAVHHVSIIDIHTTPGEKKSTDRKRKNFINYFRMSTIKGARPFNSVKRHFQKPRISSKTYPLSTLLTRKHYSKKIDSNTTTMISSKDGCHSHPTTTWTPICISCIRRVICSGTGAHWPSVMEEWTTTSLLRSSFKHLTRLRPYLAVVTGSTASPNSTLFSSSSRYLLF